MAVTYSGDAATTRTNLGLGSLATANSVSASTIDDNSVGAAELNVSGNGTSGQALLSDGDGTFSWGDAGGGKVLQVVSTYYTSQASTTSTSYTNISGFSVSITPSSASSKIFVMLTIGSVGQATGGKRTHFAVSNFPNGSGTSGHDSVLTITPRSTDEYWQLGGAANYLHSPASTSTQTYQVSWKVEQYTSYINRSSSGDSYSGDTVSSITAMEIAA